MNILFLGGGGREHALAWAIARNPKCARLIAAPGNPGIAALAGLAPDLDILNGAAVAAFCAAEAVDLVVIGPEAPLEAGGADALAGAGIAVRGPSAAAARLETSKAYAKEIAAAAGVPTAPWAVFDDPAAARAHIEAAGAPIVVKADGLAAGKGVVVAETLHEARAAVDAVFAGPGGGRVVIEAFMAGEEASLFLLVDGESVLPLGTAQDHKRALDGDRGPNTGGMGAYSPAPVMTSEVTARALREIVRPTLAEMARRGTPYRGVLYAGLMIEAGRPRLVEWNARLGDPEAQVIAMRLGGQLLDAFEACATGRLAEARIAFAEDHALCVVLAAPGYPGPHRTGEALDLPPPGDPRVEVFHAGTALEAGRLVSRGGRVLAVTARGASLAEARDLAYDAIGRIGWPGAQFRRDIGHRALGGD
ncbi:phosphoribosylamine--glycine ligase [soil metagenome]